VVQLAGVIALKSYFGPPNYGEDPKTDSIETQAVLKLSSPLCVQADPQDHSPAESDQTMVTLVPLGKMDLGTYAGSVVVVIGTLFHANTGHHHTPVLLQIERIER
jgi:Domain of unknown function (DUF4431)